MRKRMMTLAAVAVLAITLTACGAAQTSNSPAPTVEPTKEAEATTAPTVEPTKEAEATTAPTVEPTEVPEVTPTETPVEPEVTVEPTEAPTQAPTEAPVEPTVAPTEAPEVTVEPTETPAEPTEVPSGNPSDVAEDPNFAVIKEMTENHVKDNDWGPYNELEALIETLDKSRYEVTAMDNIDLIVPEDTVESDRRMFEELIFTDYNLFDLAEITTEDGDTYYVDVFPTGKFYVMTLTDTVTGETIVWGLKVHAESMDNPGEYYVLTYNNGIFNMLDNHMPVKDCYVR